MKGFVYILLCADGSFYTGSTNDLERRMLEHQNGKGSNHTRKRLPIELVYFEEYDRIDDAFYRERQIHGWSRAKKIALIENRDQDLPGLAKSGKLPSTASRSGSDASMNNCCNETETMKHPLPEPVESSSLIRTK